MIDIHLKEIYEKNSEKIIEDFFDKNKMLKMSHYMQNKSNDFPNLKLLCYKKKLRKVDKYIWFIKRFILDFINFFLQNQFKLNAKLSKDIHENLAIQNYQLNTSSRKIIALDNGNLIHTSLWNHRVHAAKDFIKILKEIDANSILEVGCGQGIMLFTMLQLESGFLNKRKWVGFDFSVASALTCKSLFKNYNPTKDKNIEIYNGDATSIHFKNKSFDVTICNSVLDQIKYEKLKAISEMTRVSKYSVIREPLFKKQSFSGKLHFKRNDYCQLDLEDFKDFGEILSVEHSDLTDPVYAHSLILLKNFSNKIKT